MSFVPGPWSRGRTPALPPSSRLLPLPLPSLPHLPHCPIMTSKTSPFESDKPNLVIDIVSTITTHAVLILKYVHRNAWTIVFLIAGGYFCYFQCEYMVCVDTCLCFKSLPAHAILTFITPYPCFPQHCRHQTLLKTITITTPTSVTKNASHSSSHTQI